MKTLLTMLTSAAIATGATLCVTANKESMDSRIPVPEENQQVLLHPGYLAGDLPLGYTLLTDVDGNGSWDVLERVSSGYATGSYVIEKVYSESCPRPQSFPPDYTVVSDDYFKPYQ